MAEAGDIQATPLKPFVSRVTPMYCSVDSRYLVVAENTSPKFGFVSSRHLYKQPLCLLLQTLKITVLFYNSLMIYRHLLSASFLFTASLTAHFILISKRSHILYTILQPHYNACL